MTEKNSLDLEDLIAEEPRTRISAAEACSMHDYCRGYTGWFQERALIEHGRSLRGDNDAVMRVNDAETSSALAVQIYNI